MRNTDLISDRLDTLCGARKYERFDGEGEREAMRRLLNGAVNTLTQRQRQCIVLYYFDGKTVKQTAEMIGISPSTVSRHLKAGKSKLQRLRAMIM